MPSSNPDTQKILTSFESMRKSLEKSLGELNKTLARAVGPKQASQQMGARLEAMRRHPSWTEVDEGPEVLLEVPVTLDWLPTPISGTASILKNIDGSTQIDILIPEGVDSEEIVSIVKANFVKALRLSNVEA